LSNTIRANLAHAIGTGYGGGISAIPGPEPISISQNLIEGNIASRGGLGDGNGGGIWLSGQGVIRVEDNLIRANVAAITGVVSLGGGLYMQTAPVSGTLDLSLIGNTIQQNIAALNANIGGGGGLFLCCQVTMAGNTIISNTALVTSTGVLTGQNILGGIGGGIFLEGAQVQSAGDLIRGNSASWGGGGYVELSQYAATNGVIRDNTSPTAAPGLVIGLNSRVELLHLTIAHNTGGVGNAILLTDVSIAPGTGPEPSSLSLTNTILADHLLGISVVGANSVTANGLLWFNTPLRVTAGPAALVSIKHDYIGDPAFASDGYHLTARSAAINRGVQAGLVVDLEGEPRNHRPDLGADEYPGLINELFLSLIER
jgi:hypothetical protein